MAFTQAQLDTLDDAIANGVLTVQTSDGKSVTFPSLDDLLRRRRLVANALASGGARRRGGVSYVNIKRDEGG